MKTLKHWMIWCRSSKNGGIWLKGMGLFSYSAEDSTSDRGPVLNCVDLCQGVSQVSDHIYFIQSMHFIIIYIYFRSLKGCLKSEIRVLKSEIFQSSEFRLQTSEFRKGLLKYMYWVWNPYNVFLLYISICQ